MPSALLKGIKAAAYLEGDFVTRAGKPTTYYIDKYRFETDPVLLDAVTDALVALFPSSDSYDRIAGPELGAVPLAAVLSVKLKKPFVIVRKEPKGYGTSNQIEGPFDSGDRVVMVEDILTTGGAVLKASLAAVAAGLTVVQIIGVINREEGAVENLAAAGFSSVTSLFTRRDLQSC